MFHELAGKPVGVGEFVVLYKTWFPEFAVAMVEAVTETRLELKLIQCVENVTPYVKFRVDKKDGRVSTKRNSPAAALKDATARTLLPNETKQAVIDKITALRTEIAQKEKQAAETREKEEQLRLVTRKNKIEAFWETEGEEIWKNQRKITLAGIDFLVLERPASGDCPARSVMLHLSAQPDFTNKEHIRIERGGIEIRGSNDEMRVSFWSGSQYEIEGNLDDWKEVVYEEFSRL